MVLECWVVIAHVSRCGPERLKTEVWLTVLQNAPRELINVTQLLPTFRPINKHVPIIYFAHCSCLIITLRPTTSFVRCHQTVRRDATWPLCHWSGLVFACGTCELSAIVCERLCEGPLFSGKVNPLNNGVYRWSSDNSNLSECFFVFTAVTTIVPRALEYIVCVYASLWWTKQ